MPNSREHKTVAMADGYEFGYPRQCGKCGNNHRLQVRPSYFPRRGRRLMLIGQDPTIRKNPDQVDYVLMLNDPNSQLSRWLRDLFGEKVFDSAAIYATNAVKCTFQQMPGKADLRQSFRHCSEYLGEEVILFNPACVVTLGEPAHRLFVSILDNQETIPCDMKQAFDGQFIKVRFRGKEFDYSPCLHIQTFRVADTYGDKVKKFRQGIARYFKATDRGDPGD